MRLSAQSVEDKMPGKFSRPANLGRVEFATGTAPHHRSWKWLNFP
jgi:hypothetical protein